MDIIHWMDKAHLQTSRLGGNQMVRQKPKGYNQRQQDKHLEKLKNKQKKQKRKKAKVIIKKDHRSVEAIAADFSLLIIEKTSLSLSLRDAKNLNEAFLKENQQMRKHLKNLENITTCLCITIICLLAAGIFLFL